MSSLSVKKIHFLKPMNLGHALKILIWSEFNKAKCYLFFFFFKRGLTTGGIKHRQKQLLWHKLSAQSLRTATKIVESSYFLQTSWKTACSYKVSTLRPPNNQKFSQFHKCSLSFLQLTISVNSKMLMASILKVRTYRGMQH